MDLPQEIDDYIKDSIDHSLGLPLPTKTLELKLSVSQEAQRRLRNRCLSLQYKLREKDELIDRIRVRTFQFYAFYVCMYVCFLFLDLKIFFFLNAFGDVIGWILIGMYVYVSVCVFCL